MEIRLIEIKALADVDLPTLMKRAQESSKSTKTIHYRAVKDGETVAFVSLDRWPELDHMVLYEIFVPKELRCRGIGSAVLAEVENTAIREGMPRMRLRPKPLDQGISQANLAAWYAKHGYEWDSTTAGDMQKDLSTEIDSNKG